MDIKSAKKNFSMRRHLRLLANYNSLSLGKTDLFVYKSNTQTSLDLIGETIIICRKIKIIKYLSDMQLDLKRTPFAFFPHLEKLVVALLTMVDRPTGERLLNNLEEDLKEIVTCSCLLFLPVTHSKNAFDTI